MLQDRCTGTVNSGAFTGTQLTVRIRGLRSPRRGAHLKTRVGSLEMAPQSAAAAIIKYHKLP